PRPRARRGRLPPAARRSDRGRGRARGGHRGPRASRRPGPDPRPTGSTPPTVRLRRGARDRSLETPLALPSFGWPGAAAPLGPPADRARRVQRADPRLVESEDALEHELVVEADGLARPLDPGRRRGELRRGTVLQHRAVHRVVVLPDRAPGAEVGALGVIPGRHHGRRRDAVPPRGGFTPGARAG